MMIFTQRRLSNFFAAKESGSKKDFVFDHPADFQYLSTNCLSVDRVRGTRQRSAGRRRQLNVKC